MKWILTLSNEDINLVVNQPDIHSEEYEILLHQVMKGDKGEGVPAGGTAGQYLRKRSSDDFDTEWANIDTYTHEQGSAADVWVITHNLNKYPSVTIVDSSGDEVVGSVNYVDLNKCVVTFTAPFKGKAFLN